MGHCMIPWTILSEHLYRLAKQDYGHVLYHHFGVSKVTLVKGNQVTHVQGKKNLKSELLDSQLLIALSNQNQIDPRCIRREGGRAWPQTTRDERTGIISPSKNDKKWIGRKSGQIFSHFQFRNALMWRNENWPPTLPSGWFRLMSLLRLVLIRGVASFQGWICTIQWTPSNPATLGTSQSVLIRGVASFREAQTRGSSTVLLQIRLSERKSVKNFNFVKETWARLHASQGPSNPLWEAGRFAISFTN